jgi:hypothetical protein
MSALLRPVRITIRFCWRNHEAKRLDSLGDRSFHASLFSVKPLALLAGIPLTSLFRYLIQHPRLEPETSFHSFGQCTKRSDHANSIKLSSNNSV